MAQHNELGKKGEEVAINYLIAKGFVIRDRNWRFQKAEVDIIAQKENLLIAVEVKTRTSTDFGMPQDFVNPKKIKLLVKAMDAYITSLELDMEFRFDIIGVVPKGLEYEIEHLEDAFLYF
ncbi:MAG: YraN family protein [Flavobacteriaceae bacterium]